MPYFFYLRSGLINDENNCHLNSNIQLMVSIPAILAAVKKAVKKVTEDGDEGCRKSLWHFFDKALEVSGSIVARSRPCQEQPSSTPSSPSPSSRNLV